MQRSILISLLIVVFAGGYVTYRYAKLPDMAHEALSDLRTLPPFHCSFTTSSFDASGKGEIYHAGLRVASRTTLTDSQGTFTGRQLLDEKGNNYLWQEEIKIGGLDTNGPQGLEVPFADALIHDHTRFDSTCSPWWWPDMSRFALPKDIDFVNVPGSDR